MAFARLASNAVFSFLETKKIIICLDDFERMSLDAQAVLGLISELKEERKCKIILIMNDERLGEKQEQYNVYREKVIDKELVFAPTADECAKSAVNSKQVHADIIRQRCCKLDITNIRIVQRICRLATELDRYFKGTNAETRERALSDLVVLTWAFYTHDDTKPCFEFVTTGKRASTKDINDAAIMEGLDKASKESGHAIPPKEPRRKITNEERKELEKEKKWNSLIWDYRVHRDSLFDEIAASVKRGYFIDDKIQSELQKYEKEVTFRAKQQDFRQALYELVRTFDNKSIKEVTEPLYNAAQDYIEHIPQNSGDTSYLINSDNNLSIFSLRQLGADDKANALTTQIEDKLSSRLNSANIYKSEELANDLTDSAKHELVLDEAFKEMLDRVIKEKKSKLAPTPIQALEHCIVNEGYSDRHKQALEPLDADQFYTLLRQDVPKSSKSKDDLHQYHFHQHYTYRCIRWCFEHGNRDNINQALDKIAAESPLNKFRVEEYRKWLEK